MARRAACENGCAWRIELLLKLAPHLYLVSGRLPFHVEDLVLRPEEPFRLAVAFEAPLHLQRCDLPRQRHQVDSPVTGRAAHAFVDVNRMVEINEVWQVVHASPLDGLSSSPAFAHRLKVGAVGEDLRVAIHAGLCRRNASEGRSLNRCVAVAAINPVVARVMLMAELNWLLARNEGERVVGRALILCHKPKHERDEEDCAEDAHL